MGCSVMTCRVGVNVIACGPPPGVYHRRIMQCDACHRRHRFVVRWDGAWYGTTEYGACGDRWQDGRMWERPFQRGWRDKAQQKFRDMWDNAVPRELYKAYVNADINLSLADDENIDAVIEARQAVQQAIIERRAA